jgi:hypothetical protein
MVPLILVAFAIVTPEDEVFLICRFPMLPCLLSEVRLRLKQWYWNLMLRIEHLHYL